MADDVAVTAGAGTSIATDDCGGRHVQLFKQAIATDGSATLVPADATNGLRVNPSVAKVPISVTPTISTSPAYTASPADQVGGKMTFTGAARISGGSGTITQATINARWANTIVPSLELLLFSADPTVASVDNGTADITDANRETPRELSCIKFLAANWHGLSGNTACDGSVLGGQPSVDFVTSGSANLFGILVTRTVFTAASTTDIRVTLHIRQD